MSGRRARVTGSGIAGTTLAAEVVRHGHETMIGSRDPSQPHAWTDETGPRVAIGSSQKAARYSVPCWR